MICKSHLFRPPGRLRHRARGPSDPILPEESEAPSSGAPAPGPASLEEDLPSEDDEDAEEAGAVGLEVVKRLLGATVLEEVTVTQEGR